VAIKTAKVVVPVLAAAVDLTEYKAVKTIQQRQAHKPLIILMEYGLMDIIKLSKSIKGIGNMAS
jgi:hypothetical protein